MMILIAFAVVMVLVGLVEWFISHAEVPIGFQRQRLIFAAFCLTLALIAGIFAR